MEKELKLRGSVWVTLRPCGTILISFGGLLVQTDHVSQTRSALNDSHDVRKFGWRNKQIALMRSCLVCQGQYFHRLLHPKLAEAFLLPKDNAGQFGHLELLKRCRWEMGMSGWNSIS